MTFCLESTIIKPEKGTDIKNIIVLLHGYGGDGKDISMLTLNWKRHLPNTVFICPNGHEKCDLNPSIVLLLPPPPTSSPDTIESSLLAEESPILR